MVVAFNNEGCIKEIEQIHTIQRDTVFIFKVDTVLVKYSFVEEYNSGNNSELVPVIKVSTDGNWNDGEVVFSIKLQNLKKNDIIEALADFEVTNDLGFNVSVISQIVFADSPLKKPNSDNIQEITEANGYQITPNMHHGHIVKVGSLICPENYNERYINVCVRARSDLAKKEEFISVGGNPFNQDYGRLSVILFKQ